MLRCYVFAVVAQLNPMEQNPVPTTFLNVERCLFIIRTNYLNISMFSDWVLTDCGKVSLEHHANLFSNFRIDVSIPLGEKNMDAAPH